MRISSAVLCLALGCVILLPAKTVVFRQAGFPTVASQPVTRDALVRALADADTVFGGIEGLKDPATLAGASLLVLPYGSAVPALFFYPRKPWCSGRKASRRWRANR